jgi:hypothetical protein
MKKYLVFLACLVIAACSPSQIATIPPSPQPVKIAFSPSFEFIENAVHACANHLPELAIIVDKIPASSTNVNNYDLTIWWGGKPVDAPFAYPLAQDDLVIILNQENPNRDLSTDELRVLYSGKVQNWDEISTYQAAVSVWIYPERNELRGILEENLMSDIRFTSLAYLAPDPQAMLEAVARDPGAVGFVPRSWLNQDVKITQIDQELHDALVQPVLALSSLEPQGGPLVLLDCLQNGVGQTILLNHYSPPN